jgi:hypothetical protein
MEHILQISLFLLLILFAYLIYKTETFIQVEQPTIDIHVDGKSTPPVQVHVRKRPSQPPQPPKPTPVDKYKNWRHGWLGRNTPIKSCYQNCQGLRTREYRSCSESCVSQDTFDQ